jgi:gliding motility-associated-like protein
MSVTTLTASTYNVTVAGVTGNGTLGLNLKSSGTGITDLSSNALINGFTGQVYTVDKITIAPTITSPTSNSALIGQNLPVNINIPEVNFANTITLTFQNASNNVVITLNNTSGTISNTLNTSNLLASAIVASSSQGTLPSGVYTVTLRYQDYLGNPVASASITNFSLNLSLSSTIVVTGLTTYTYNGSAQGPITSTVTGSTASPTYSYSGSGTTTYGAIATLPTAAGTYQVIATVAGDGTYSGATSAAYAFTINKAASTIVVTGSTTYTYNGAAHGPSTSTVTGSTGAVTYSYVGTGGTTYGPSATAPTLNGSYEVVATVAGDANYTGASSAAFAFTIAQYGSNITVTGLTTYTYNGSAQGPITSTVTGSTATPTYSYSGTGTTTYGPSATLPTTPGTYQVIGSVAANGAYTSATSAAYAFTINKATSTIVATGATTFTYNTSAQGPSTSTVTGSTGAVTYSYVGTGGTTYGPSATPPKLPGTYQVIATVAGDANYSGASSVAYVFAITQIIPPPIVTNAKVIFSPTSAPKTLATLVVNKPTGSIPAWCDVNAANCDTIAPKFPTIIGKYVYQLRSYDTTTLLYSTNYVNDTIVIAPPKPIAFDSTYVIGVTSNPSNVSLQVSGLTGASFNYYYLNNAFTGVPTLGNTPGVKKYTVSQTVNSVEGDTTTFGVTMLDPASIIHLQKIVDSGKLQSNSTFNYPFTFLVSNLTKYPFSNVVVTDNLHNSVPITSDFSVISNTATGGLIANNRFDGLNDINVIAPSTLAPFAIDTSRFTMNLVPKGYTGTLSNIAYVKADTKWGTIVMQSSASATNGTYASTTYYVKDLPITIPEGFSPNHDGVHDYFVIIKPYNVTLDLQIFNRWGNIVYANSNYKNEWDGKGSGNFAGQDLVDGGYYYTLRAVDDKGATQVFNGYVIIQR